MADAAPARAERIIDGRYRLLQPLGQGGMGTVYEAEHVFTHRHVAVKILHAQLAANPEVVRRFLHEARSAARIVHPHCVDILDMGQAQDGTLYLVEELLVGVDLRRHLNQVGRLPPREALAIALPITEALAAAHTQGVLHRDVKPGNIFLANGPGSTRIPKLIDFGIAKAFEVADDGPEQTRTGMTMGTPSHMAPEQLRGERGLDGRIDVWAMGVVLYEMLTGHCPFEGGNAQFLMVKILTERAPRIERWVQDLPAGLGGVVHHALEPEREQRLGSMEEFRTALLACVQGSAPHRRSSTPVATVGAEVPSEDQTVMDPIMMVEHSSGVFTQATPAAAPARDRAPDLISPPAPARALVPVRAELVPRGMSREVMTRAERAWPAEPVHASTHDEPTLLRRRGRWAETVMIGLAGLVLLGIGVGVSLVLLHGRGQKESPLPAPPASETSPPPVPSSPTVAPTAPAPPPPTEPTVPAPQATSRPASPHRRREVMLPRLVAPATTTPSPVTAPPAVSAPAAPRPPSQEPPAPPSPAPTQQGTNGAPILD
ncbi:MAG TPA: serine/threonine-protein kinase [Polyangia bacterium]|jgi:serine/threonine-protein kinase|nr:serine/threonine-protein kinase [Polyangia bacterium]